jgi:hypothetical protein
MVSVETVWMKSIRMPSKTEAAGNTVAYVPVTQGYP